MLVAGVFLSGGDVAVLASCLERVGEVELANTFAHALDAGQPEMRLGPLDEDALFHAIDRCPPQFATAEKRAPGEPASFLRDVTSYGT